MTNKMPVVGKKYRTMPQFSRPYVIEVIAITNKWIVAKTNKYFSFENEVIENFLLDGWEKEFEELLEDNLQETEEMKVNERANPVDLEKVDRWLPISCAPKCGSVITVKQGDKIFKAHRFLNKWYSLYEGGGNEEVYPESWLEKGEINKVERALEELNNELEFRKTPALKIFNNGELWQSCYDDLHIKAQKLIDALEAEKQKGTTDQENKYFQAGWVAAREMFRKANDETKEAMKLMKFQVDNYCKEYINEVDPRFLPPLFIKTLERARNLLNALDKQFCSKELKPEAKIDIQKPSVEPVSIWKDVSELPKNLDGAAILYKYMDQIYIGEVHSFGEPTIYPAPNCDYIDNSNVNKVCLLTDFINSFEQMQKDIKERK